MLNWREIPFVRLLLPFLLGLSLALSINKSVDELPYLLLFLFLILIAWRLVRIPYQFRWVFGFLLHLFIIGFGYSLAIQHHECKSENHFQKYLTTENWLLAQIDEYPRPGKKIRVSAKVLGIGNTAEDENKLQDCDGNILLYLTPQAAYSDLRYGDQLLLRAKAHPILPPKNPAAFDFQKYQHFKNIHYQVFAKSDQWILLQRDQGNPILSTAFAIRSHFLKTLRKHLPTNAEFGVAAALILGNRDALTEEVSTAYASTGATHVLAVSGLHVGFIYLGLAFLFRFFRFRGRVWTAIKTLLLILGVWAFAFITGASPSVLRAATMFSFIIVGQTLHRYTNIYNTLAASAFLLLCINPYLIAAVGFQLSYLAVLGIVSFQQWIYRAWIIDHPLGDYTWNLMAVSLAAQLTTFPLSLFYFHQFPFYFWLSGLIVVPAAMFVLGGGLLLFFLENTLPFLADFIGILLYWIIWLMNALIHLIQQLPAALIQGIWVSTGGLVLLYLGMLWLTYVFGKGKKHRALASMFCLFVFFGAIAWQSFTRLEQREIVVYQVARNSLMDLVDGRSLVSIQSPDLEEKTIDFAAQNYRWKLGIREHQQFSFNDHKIKGSHYFLHRGFLQFYDLKWGFLGPKNAPSSTTESIALDYLVLRNTPNIDVAKIQLHYPGATWIADSSNAPWKVATWQQKCESLSIPFINLSEKGAQIISLK